VNQRTSLLSERGNSCPCKWMTVINKTAVNINFDFIGAKVQNNGVSATMFNGFQQEKQIIRFSVLIQKNVVPLQPNFIAMSQLQNKSEMFAASAKLLYDNYYYPSVAHSAYYSCYQLLKHIWLYSMKKTEPQLVIGEKKSKTGSHEYLINETISYIENSGKKECRDHARDMGSKITQLKRLRRSADYDDTAFDSSKSLNSIRLSDDIIPVLKKY